MDWKNQGDFKKVLQRILQNCYDKMTFYSWDNGTHPLAAPAPGVVLQHPYPRSVLYGFCHMIRCDAIASRQVCYCAG